MSKIKKLVLSLSVVVTMAIAFVIGIVGNSSSKPLISGGGDYINSSDTPVSQKVEAKPLTYTYAPNEVVVQQGSSTLEFSYSPSVDTQDSATTVAYEYIFQNPMSDETAAINLKSIDTTGVNVSYVYSDSELDTNNVITGETQYRLQTLENENDRIYIYVLVAPTDTSIPATFTTNVKWYVGKLKEITISNNVNNATTTQAIVAGQPIDNNTLTKPTAPEGYYFDAWFLDKDYTKLVETDEFKPGQQLYARYHNFPLNSTSYMTYSNGSYSVTGNPKIPNLIVPTLYDNGTNGEAKVTSIRGDVFNDYYELISINLPSSLTSIGDGAFIYCGELTSINLPSSLTSIGNSAFSDCFGLTSINLPSSLTSIGNSAFSACHGLTSIDLSKCTSLTTIGDNTFNECRGLTSITIPASVTSIGDWAFYNCSGLTSISLPSSLTSIGDYAFYNCSGLTSISLPSTVTSIGDNAFYYCSGLTSIDLSNCTSLTSIGDSVFETCRVLTSISLPSSLTSIGNAAFYYSGLTSISLPSSLTSIGDNAFHGCYTLCEVYNLSNLSITAGSKDNGYVGCYAKVIHTSIATPSRIQTIGNMQYYVYGNDFIAVAPTGSSRVVLDSRTTEIYKYAFYQYTKLTSIDLSNCTSLTSIGNFAFSYCNGLTSIDLSKCTRLTSIGDNAFSESVVLTSVSLPNSLISIGDVAFGYCGKLTNITIPANVTKIGRYAFSGEEGESDNITSITFSDTSTWYRVSSEANWNNMTGGTQTDVSNASTNATYFKSTYTDYYWYKK